MHWRALLAPVASDMDDQLYVKTPTLSGDITWLHGAVAAMQSEEDTLCLCQIQLAGNRRMTVLGWVDYKKKTSVSLPDAASWEL